ncbi:MAG: WYL domain-containing protein, partial [Muribaculaceae bacterium]|nr:WYL domain-containing protein [Muribaculaceae bacterium]
WYVIGLNVADNKIKTYALDRISDPSIQPETFTMPEDLDVDSFFGRSFGITVLDTPPRRITIRTDHRESKYLRALPLHHSQQEVIHDGFSLFYYTMQITDDLVRELISYGNRLTVISPPELRREVRDRLAAALANYDDTTPEAIK